MLGVEAADPQERPSRGDRRACGHQPDELGAFDVDAARVRLRLDAREDVVESGRLVVLDVHAHLRMTGAGERKPEGANSGETAASLAHDRGDLARNARVVGREVDVERDQRPAGADDDAARTRIETWRPEVGGDLAG